MPGAARHETRVSDLRQNHDGHSFGTNPPNALGAVATSLREGRSGVSRSLEDSFSSLLFALSDEHPDLHRPSINHYCRGRAKAPGLPIRLPAVCAPRARLPGMWGAPGCWAGGSGRSSLPDRRSTRLAGTGD
jgi:hypothetical protein